jgi:uncharacterized repeat protein (TIGR03803 family)
MGGNLNDCGGQGCGVAFRLSPNATGGWQETALHTFTGGADGAGSLGALVIDTAGSLYGTAYSGGNLAYCSGSGCGVVFKLATTSSGSWKETLLHTFTGGADGAGPSAPLAFGPDGKLYGTTAQGGSANVGVVFRIAP